MKIYPLSVKAVEPEEFRMFLNRALERDFITKHMFKRTLIDDPNLTDDLILMAYEGNTLIGALIGVYRSKAPPEYVEKQKNVAWIKALGIHPKYRSDKVFEKLLEEFIDQAKSDGKDTIRFSDFASWHFFPGLDIRYEYYLQKFLKQGFTKSADVVDYEVDLLFLYLPRTAEKREEKLREEGVVFRELNAYEKERIAAWAAEKFSPCWGIEASMALEEPEGGVWVAEKDGKILGFSVYGATEPNWFGPIGVDSAVRGRGIGTVLLYKSLESLRVRGYRYIVIPWTGHLFFYTQLPGVKSIRHYWILEKKLK